MKLGKSQREKNLRQVASVAAFNSDGQMLMGLRGDVRKWCCPGGHLEPDETPAKGAVRELLEETGLKAKSLERLGSSIVGKNKNVQVHCYRADVEGSPSGADDPDAEFVEFRWVDPDDLPEDIVANLYNKQDATLQLLGAQARDLELSKASLAEIMARTTAVMAHIRALAAQGPMSHVFPHPAGGSVVVGIDPSKPDRWRATRIDAAGVPVGHVEAEDHHQAIKHAHHYGADVMAVQPFKKTAEDWLEWAALHKASNLSLEDAEEEKASGVALDMLGFNPIVHPAFAAAQFLTGKPVVSLDVIRRALYEHENYLDAALAAYGLPVDEGGRSALRGVMRVADFTKSMVPERLPEGKDIEAGTPDAEDAADAVRRAFKTQRVKVAHLDGKHSKGSLIARDDLRDKTLLLKPGSGGPGPAAGASEDPASPSRREAAFWQLAEDWGLGESVPRTDLVIIDGQEYAAIHMLPFDWKGLQKRLDTDPVAGRQAFNSYRDRGFIHKWAVMDFVLGNPDRHADNLMLSPDRDLLALIDHGSAFAGPHFDPARDANSFVPFYLRAWAPMDNTRFNKLRVEQKLRYMPTVSAHMKDELRTWLNDIHADHLEGICHRFGIPPQPQLDRLAKVKVLASSMGVDEAINRLWVTT